MKKSIIVVGAGPGGISAAVTAAENGAQVTIVDENPGLGGQIWRQQLGKVKDKNAKVWIDRLSKQNVHFEASATVLYRDGQTIICSSALKGKFSLEFDDLILACGAKELLLPFPGWTLPNVLGCGGAQAMAKSGLDVMGKRVVVSGSGPLLLAVASYLKSRGAKVVGIYEQARASRLNRLALYLFSRFPSKILQGLVYRLSLLSTTWKKGWWVKKAQGDSKLESVVVTNGSKEQQIDCDILACGFGLKANLELPKILGCKISSGFVEVSDTQQTSEKDIYAVGELTGIGGLDKAILEGANAANYISAREEDVQSKRSIEGFVDKLAETFELRDEVKNLAESKTIFCRCEDVAFEEVCDEADQRSAKLYSRCGMGSCQGRICSTMGQELFGWELNKIQSPAVSVAVESLID